MSLLDRIRAKSEADELPPTPGEGADTTIDSRSSTSFDATRNAVAAGTRGNVSIYALDPRGLHTVGSDLIDAPTSPDDDPRLLVFDVASSNDKDIAARYATLRSLAHVLPYPLCVVQWVGDATVLPAFTRSLPHGVDGLVGLTASPWKMYIHTPPALQETVLVLSTGPSKRRGPVIQDDSD